MEISEKKKKDVIPQVRTITRYDAGSVILFNCAESPIRTQRRLLSLFRDFQFRTNEFSRLVHMPVHSVLLASLRELKVAE